MITRGLFRSLAASLIVTVALLPSAEAAKKKKKKAAAPAQVEEQTEVSPPPDLAAPAEEPPKVEPLAPAEPKPGETKPAESKESASAKKGPFPRIADEEETIYAVQRKAYLVNRKIELTPMFAASFTDRFVRTFAPAGSITYHVAENFGLELFGAYFFPAESGLTTEILDKGKLTPELAKLTQMLWAVGLGVQWSPIYGKVQLFGSSLGNFNFYLGAGGGIGATRVQCTPGLELDPNAGFNPSKCPMLEVDRTNPNAEMPRGPYEPARTHFMGALSGGVRFYFSNRIGLKLEVKDWVFTARVFRPGLTAADSTQRFTDAVRNNIFAQLGISFLLGGEE